MKQLLRKLFTKKIAIHSEKENKKIRYTTIPPSERLVTGIIFAIASLTGLIVLAIAHLAFLKSWNSEIFAAITSIIGTILGVFISQKT
ncbi:MAG: hypothetical protein ACQXXH_04855 [Candidatus Bathyarchaeia archaeon]|nr:hypothetical protein [Candidatus Bathyarchaeota archaeon A05DMB-4]MDH7595063.1 hypothetical protein [Candidatus Bathyarchaeota archaeon]